MTANTTLDTIGDERAAKAPGRLMTVGELSRRTGMSIKNLREYTDIGLIYTLGRSPANYRLFGTEALRCVRCIRELRGLGLTVAEIRDLANTSRDPAGGSCEVNLAERLRVSRRRVHARIAELQQTLHRIEAFETRYHAGLTEPGALPGDNPPCPVADTQVRA